MKNDYEKVRTSRNELEAILRIRGISKQRFGRVLNIKGSTIEKYLDNPYHLRYYQMQRLANFLNIDVKDVIDIIVHIFHPKKRKFYDIEKMWSEPIPKEKIVI